MSSLVQKNCHALKHACEDLQKDKNIVIQAVRNHGSSIIYASDNLRVDPDVILEAVKTDENAIF